jgi:hypothetical protein
MSFKSVTCLITLPANVFSTNFRSSSLNFKPKIVNWSKCDCPKNYPNFILQLAKVTWAVVKKTAIIRKPVIKFCFNWITARTTIGQNNFFVGPVVQFSAIDKKEIQNIFLLKKNIILRTSDLNRRFDQFFKRVEWTQK